MSIINYSNKSWHYRVLWLLRWTLKYRLDLLTYPHIPHWNGFVWIWCVSMCLSMSCFAFEFFWQIPQKNVFPPVRSSVWCVISLRKESICSCSKNTKSKKFSSIYNKYPVLKDPGNLCVCLSEINSWASTWG